LNGVISVVTTMDDRETLERMGRQLLERRLIACLQVIGPIKSLYWWKGKVEESEEWMGIMKTRRDLYDRVEEEIRALHPYEVPEILAMEADKVVDTYAQWVMGETLA